MPDNINTNIGFELESNKLPKAVITPVQQEAVVGSIVKMDGRQSVDPENNGLTYIWSFSQVPIGSQVQKTGFNAIEEDLSVVGFAPDIIGTYIVNLVVNDGSLDSEPTEGRVDTRVILVPHHKGIVPDAGFIWNYLSDFWKLVEGRKKFEIFWSSAIQVAASSLLKMYQYDYNKSIKDIQESIQKRWIPYESRLSLDPTDISFIMAQDQAGISASTFKVDTATGLTSDSQPDFTTFIGIPKSEALLDTTNFGSKQAIGKVIRIGDRSFTTSIISGVSRAVVHNQDGALIPSRIVSSATGGFLAATVGDTIAFLTPGVQVPSAIIRTIFDDNAIDIFDPVWSGTSSGIEFTVIPAIPNNNAIFVTRSTVPGRQSNKAWRISATLISASIDFEDQGVSIGDVIAIQVDRQDVALSGTLSAQVVSVDGSRLGFVINLDDLVDGVAAKEISIADQISLALSLQVPGLFINPDGSLFYSGDAQTINSTITSFVFRRKYYEKVLTPSTVIDVGAFSVTVTPLYIIRNKTIPVDVSVKSVPVLQEYIRQPDLVDTKDGLSVVTAGGEKPVTHEPYVLIENLDYVIDDDATIVGSCTVVQGSDVIQVPFGDLLDRSISEGDSISVTDSNAVHDFHILQVIDEENIRVTPTPVFSATTATFTLQRRVVGRFIRFVKDVFSKKIPAPERLWAEVTYFDNNDAVENNFGVLVGLTREDVKKIGAQIPYKSAVSGLMYALTKGPTVSNLQLAAQILLGLPFTLLPGVITEINPEFKKTDTGVPLFGRILIEARDKNDKPTGITNIYLYPLGKQNPDPDNPGEFIPAFPDISGLAINPNTGVEFVVGDHVAQFVPLSKGVQIKEYVGTPNWFLDQVNQGSVAANIEKFHAFNLSINSDLVSDADVDLAASFIRKAKPTYTKLTSGLLKSLEDEVDIDDALIFTLAADFFENVGLSLPTAAKLDRTDFDGSFLGIEGTMYTLCRSGDDLVTTQGSNNVTSAVGGFLNAPSIFMDSPFLRGGDLLVIEEGPNKGQYPIQSVPSNTQLNLVSGSFVFQTISPPVSGGTRQPFVIYRPTVNPIWIGTVNIVNNTSSVTINGHGIGTAGVAVGDILVFTSTASPPVPSSIYTIIGITITDIGTESLTVLPAIRETTASTLPAVVVRERLLTNNLLMGTDPSFPTEYRANLVTGSTAIVFLTGTHFLSLATVRPGDIVTYLDNFFTVLKVDPPNRTLQVAETSSVTASNVVVTIQRPTQTDTSISVDELDRIPSDFITLDFVVGPGWDVGLGKGLYTTNGSTDVTVVSATDFVDLGVMPGDLLVILTGADSTVDAGNGPGVFVIRQVLSTIQLRLVEQLTSTVNTGPGVKYSIRRERPNEG